MSAVSNVLQEMIYKPVLHKGYSQELDGYRVAYIAGIIICKDLLCSDCLRCKASIQCGKPKAHRLPLFECISGLCFLFFFFLFFPSRFLLGSLQKNTAHAQQYL